MTAKAMVVMWVFVSRGLAQQYTLQAMFSYDMFRA